MKIPVPYPVVESMNLTCISPLEPYQSTTVIIEFNKDTPKLWGNPPFILVSYLGEPPEWNVRYLLRGPQIESMKSVVVQCRLYQWANWALAQGLPLLGLLFSDEKNFAHCTLHFYINIYYTYYTIAFCLLRTVMRSYMGTCIKPVLKWVHYNSFCVLFITVQKILKTETN